jgi:hypothetical protein
MLVARSGEAQQRQKAEAKAKPKAKSQKPKISIRRPIGVVRLGWAKQALQPIVATMNDIILLEPKGPIYPSNCPPSASSRIPIPGK